MEYQQSTGITRQSLRQGYQKLMQSEDNEYSFTITFVQGLSDRKYHKSFEFFIKLLTEALYGTYHWKRKQYLEGFASREYCSDGTVHFHCIIRDKNRDLESRMAFESAIRKVLSRVTCCQESKDKLGKVKFVKKQMTGNSSYHCCRYYDQNGDDGWERYITKLFEQPGFDLQNLSDHIGVISQGEVNFGNLI